ncbi:uncharacterized protein LOC142978145 [Anticarsia gemmatalis]|uniref:uncharacterized protein LOC142978145 n=1 Tax=Anticarsia gemmatalis TaxID=129554 RepID=UPI003F7649FE
MLEEDSRHVLIDIRKPRKFTERNDELTNQTKSYLKKPSKKQPPVKKYSLPDITVIKPLPIATFNKEEVFLPYLRYSKKQETDRFTERLGVGICDNYKIAYTELRNRLHTDDPIDDTRGVTDFDPTYFSCVRSSILSKHVAPYKSLKQMFIGQVRWRQEIGYRRDCMLNIETSFQKEREVYNATVDRYMKQVKYLDEFISADYNKSMQFLNKWEKLQATLHNKLAELQYLATVKFTNTSRIVGLDYRYGLQQKYGRFLYYLSPPSWRLKNRNFARSIEIEAKGFDFGISTEEDTFNVIFEKLKKECEVGLVKPVLYFNHPHDLLKIFGDIEKQQLHHFTHVAAIAPHATFLKKGIKLFKDLIAQDSAGIMVVIKDFERMLKFREEQCSQLEAKFFKILYGSFYDDVGAPEVLKFGLHLEFCYAKVFNEKPMNLGVFGTAKALEDFYMDYSKRLDSVTADSIRAAVNQYVESERLKYKRATIAARELRLFERLERALLRAYAPLKEHHNTATLHSPSDLTVKSNKRRSTRTKAHSKPNNDNKCKDLTEAEMEYLTLFTDWTEKENPANYLRSLSMEDDKSRHRSNVSKRN